MSQTTECLRLPCKLIERSWGTEEGSSTGSSERSSEAHDDKSPFSYLFCSVGMEAQNASLRRIPRLLYALCESAL